LADIYEKLFTELSKQLPNKQDQDLLRILLDCLRKDGAKGVAEKIDEITTELEGGI